MRQLIKRLVRDLVDTVLECGDGGQALAFAEHHPDWVLMDIRIDGMDGLTVTQQITAARPEARIAIVTSYNDKSLRDAARKAGAREYVLKDDLQVLRNILARPQ